MSLRITQTGRRSIGDVLDGRARVDLDQVGRATRDSSIGKRCRHRFAARRRVGRPANAVSGPPACGARPGVDHDAASPPGDAPGRCSPVRESRVGRERAPRRACGLTGEARGELLGDSALAGPSPPRRRPRGRARLVAAGAAARRRRVPRGCSLAGASTRLAFAGACAGGPGRLGAAASRRRRCARVRSAQAPHRRSRRCLRSMPARGASRAAPSWRALDFAIS